MTPSSDRIVVTGLGAVTPLGDDVETSWSALVRGACATRVWPDLEEAGFPVPVAARIERSFEDQHRRGAHLVVEAARQAIGGAADDRPSGPRIDARRTGVFLGSTMGESAAFEAAAAASELDLASCTVASFADAVSEALGLGGPRRSVGAACAAGNYTLLMAAGALRRHRIGAAVAGGVEPFSRLAAVGFARMRAMAADVCRPFSEDRSGMLLGEAAAVVLLERAMDAERRGATPLASVEGWGLSADAHHPTAPREDGSGMAAAMRECLACAGVDASEVGWICAHGTGTPLSDAAEAKAIHEVFGTTAPPVTSFKGALGHSMGAAAAVETVMIVRALTEGILPPTANLTAVDPTIRLDVPAKSRPVEARYVLNAAYGFGGVNSAVLLGRP